MVKVILTKEQAGILEEFKNNYTFYEMVEFHGSVYRNKPIYKPLHNLTIETLSLAWLVGYEIELSADEKIYELFMELKEQSENSISISHRAECRYTMNGMNEVLHAYGIEIKGINC